MAAGMPGAAFHKPPQGQPAAAEGAMRLNRLLAVATAGGREAATAAQMGTEGHCVGVDEEGEQAAHEENRGKAESQKTRDSD